MPLPSRPLPLSAGAAVVGLQGVAMLVFAFLELVHTSSGRLGMAATTALFFLALGVGLLFFARGLVRVESWARGPVVAAELIQLLTAYSFVGGDTTPAAVVLALVAVAALVGVLHPASTRALAEAD